MTDPINLTQLRAWADGTWHAKRGIGPPDEDRGASRTEVLALIDVAEAARELRDDKYGIPHWPERDTTDSIADFTGRCDPRCLGCKLTSALARFTFEQP